MCLDILISLSLSICTSNIVCTPMKCTVTGCQSAAVAEAAVGARPQGGGGLGLQGRGNHLLMRNTRLSITQSFFLPLQREVAAIQEVTGVQKGGMISKQELCCTPAPASHERDNHAS